MTSALFPLPEPEFIFVHTVTRYRTSELAREFTSEGWQADIDLAETESDTTRCYVATPSARDVGAFDVLDVVILVPRTFVVVKGDVMETPEQPSVSPSMVGVWDISAVRPNPSHTRVMCVRSSIGSQLDT